MSPFHLAIPVHDLQTARDFYVDVLGCSEGRNDKSWADFNLFGHQLVCHQVADMPEQNANPVDGHNVPIPHFGVVLEMDDWKALRDRLTDHNITFGIEPYIRFAGQAGEQATMFFYDPSNNALEFKAFENIAEHLFKS